MSQIAEYLKESYQELVTKVTWPSGKELQSSSVLVFVASLLIAGNCFCYGLGFWCECSRLSLERIGWVDLPSSLIESRGFCHE